MNYGSWQLIDRSGVSSQTTYVPKGTMDSVIIILYVSLLLKSSRIRHVVGKSKTLKDVLQYQMLISRVLKIAYVVKN
jgi:hypothetical protein